MGELGFLSVILALFVVVLVVCWIVLPFAIIGTKPLLKELLEELRKMNRLLESRPPS